MSINAIDTTNPQPTDGPEVLLAKIATILKAGLGINASDIEIGAVEVKDGASEQRATVTADGAFLASIRKLTTTDDALVATPVASSLAASVAYAASLVVKASAGRLFCVNGYNSKGSAQFIQIHNAASVPSDAAVPVAVITVPASSNFSIDFGPLGIPLSTGIVLSNSSTGPAKTIGSPDVYFTASYL